MIWFLVLVYKQIEIIILIDTKQLISYKASKMDSRMIAFFSIRAKLPVSDSRYGDGIGKGWGRLIFFIIASDGETDTIYKINGTSMKPMINTKEKLVQHMLLGLSDITKVQSYYTCDQIVSPTFANINVRRLVVSEYYVFDDIVRVSSASELESVFGLDFSDSDYYYPREQFKKFGLGDTVKEAFAKISQIAKENKERLFSSASSRTDKNTSENDFTLDDNDFPPL